MLWKKKWGWWAGILHCGILVVDGAFFIIAILSGGDRAIVLWLGMMMLGIGLYSLIALLKPTVREHFGT